MRNAPNGVSAEAARDEVDREMQVRVRCYPRWVAEGKVSKTDANDRLTRLEAAKYFLQKVLDTEIPET